MVETPPTVILLHRGEVLVCSILLFRQGSSSASLPFTKSFLEPPAIFLVFLSSY
jgi:hypothetical protein